MGRFRRLPPPLALSLRNTFRRKARVMLTLITLVLSGVMFTMILTVDDSFGATIDSIFDMQGDDISLYMDRAYDPETLIEIAEATPGVLSAEVYSQRWATTPLESGEKHQVTLRGVPSDTEMFSPRIISGRNLRADDERAVLVNSTYADDQGIEAGDAITLTILGADSVWSIVGVTLDINSTTDDFFVPFATLARETESLHRVHYVQLTVANPGIESDKELVGALSDAYAEHHMGVTGHSSSVESRQQNVNLFGTLTYTLMSMAVLAAIVGSIGLMSTMSINVVERMREIGVMRSVGASSPTIVGLFVAEGTLLGVLSWLLAVPLSIPCAALFTSVVGLSVVGFPLDFKFSTSGVAIWLAIVVALSALASLWPAVKASRVSVRQSLAYE
ncbi:MAG: ABC transporter permease [Anaerolineales bacterium]|nr:MAG: ABC transporter permease [Anaerolineales bacterium]